MLCTDGLVETGGHDLRTGWERLRVVLEEHEDGLEELADALIQTVHGPSSHHTVGPFADRREDDIALVLLHRQGECDAGVPVPSPVRRTMMTVSQAEPARIATARQHLRDLLHDWPDEEQRDAAVLLLSELLTNVLVHTDADALLTAEVAGEPGERRIRVEVTDHGDDLPHKRRPGEMASSGRGLVLIELLADTWGVAPRGAGKSIWYELYEPTPPADAPDAPAPPSLA